MCSVFSCQFSELERFNLYLNTEKGTLKTHKMS
jgi:hypothetical protein